MSNVSNEPTIPEVLSVRNPHPRDDYIVFSPQFHTYKVLSDPNNSYVSVTTFLKPLFPPFNADDAIGALMNGRNWNKNHECWGMSRSQIKQHWFQKGVQAANNGTLLHAEIEGFMNNPTIAPSDEYTHQTLHDRYFAEQLLAMHTSETERKRNMVQETKEWDLFLRFVQDHPDMKPYRTEWVVYDETLLLAGSIDMVYENADGTLSIFDWKRVQSKKLEKTAYKNRCAIHPSVSHLPDTNYWKYALQLNVYRAILQRNYGKTVSRIALVRLLHEEDDSNYEIVECPMLDKEVESLFKSRMREIAKTRKPKPDATAVAPIAKAERVNPSRASAVSSHVFEEKDEEEKKVAVAVKDNNEDEDNDKNVLVDTESEKEVEESDNSEKEEDEDELVDTESEKEEESGEEDACKGFGTKESYTFHPGQPKPVLLMRLPQYQAHAKVTNKYISAPMGMKHRSVPPHVLAAAQARERARARQNTPSPPLPRPPATAPTPATTTAPVPMQVHVSSHVQAEPSPSQSPRPAPRVHPLRRQPRIRNLMAYAPTITTTLRRSARLQAMRQENRLKYNL